MLPILYEDNHLIAIDKPSGLPSQATPDGRKGAEDLIREFIEKRDNKPGKAFLHVVHRLDTVCSGILLLAKTSKALSRLSEAIREKTVHKRYLALIEGSFKPENERLVDYIQHGSNKAFSSEEGKKAELLILKALLLPTNTTLLFIELLTGRYHQIRFQLSQRGFPIVGDNKYGAKTFRKQGEICLHHTLLSFPHPTLKHTLTIQSLPQWEGIDTTFFSDWSGNDFVRRDVSMKG